MSLNPLCLLLSVFHVCHLLFKWCNWLLDSHGTMCLPAWVTGTFVTGRKDQVNSFMTWKLAQTHICTVLCKSSGLDECAQTWELLLPWILLKTNQKCLHKCLRQANKGRLPSINTVNSWFIPEEWIFFSILKAMLWSPSTTTIRRELNTMQTLYSNAIAKVLFVKEQILYHADIRHDLPWRLYPPAQGSGLRDGWSSQSSQHTSPYSPCGGR